MSFISTKMEQTTFFEDFELDARMGILDKETDSSPKILV